MFDLAFKNFDLFAWFIQDFWAKFFGHLWFMLKSFQATVGLRKCYVILVGSSFGLFKSF